MSDTQVSSGWIIICRLGQQFVPPPDETTDEDRVKSKQQRLAEEQEDLISKAVSGYAADGVPDWGDGGDDPAVHGDVLAKSRTSDAFWKVMSDGSIVAFVDEILHFILAKYNKSTILRMRELLLDVIPGFQFKVTPQPESMQMPSTPEGPTKPEKKKMRIETGIASDPDDTSPDFFLEAGLLYDQEDPGLGKGKPTKGKRIKSGLRLRVGDFGIFEVDLKNKELRFTMSIPEATPDELYQIRMNQDEFVVSWGKQFVAFRSTGIMLKGDLLGFAGPWAMWPKTVTSTLLHDIELSEQQMKPVAEWKEDGTGIKFKKSVYLGNSEELAVLQSFIDNVYSIDAEALKSHFHTYTPPPSPVTGNSPALQAILEATGALTEDTAISTMLSDVIDTQV
jgi:hypothetical protein